MMKNRSLTIAIIFLSIGIISCNPCKRLIRKCPVKDSISYIETVTDNPDYTIPDSAYWSLQFECDSNYEVIMRSFEELNTGLDAEIIIKDRIVYRDRVKYKQKTVDLSVFVDSIKVQNRTIEKLRSEKRTVIKEVPVDVVRNSKFARIAIIWLIMSVVLLVVVIYLKIKGGAVTGLISRFR